MSVKIIQDGHPTLRIIAQEIQKNEFDSAALHDYIKKMYEALYTQDDGVALAAPQIAISKRIFIVNEKIVGKNDEIPLDTPTIYINPKITKISKDKKKMSEGCLSVRPMYGKVKRATRIQIEAVDVYGKKFTVDAKGFLAQIFQHENDHLDGVLFIDTATDVYELQAAQEDEKK